MAPTAPPKIAFIGDYLPRKCGIATFTHDLRGAIAQATTEECIVVPVDDIEEGYDYPSEVRFQITEQDRDAYRRAADFLNFSNVEVVSLQHEFGIYGGPGGAHILAFLRDLRLPVVTTLHTVLPEPSDTQRRVMETTGRVLDAAGGDDRAEPGDPPHGVSNSRGQDRPDSPRHSRSPVSRIRTFTRISSALKANRLA